MDEAENKPNHYCMILFFFLFKSISFFIFFVLKLLDKIELDMEIADPLREYTTAKDGKLFQESTGA
jgi:hypothetical protein